jgi:ABC-type Fe3+ transport system substrate-binding protein
MSRLPGPCIVLIALTALAFAACAPTAPAPTAAPPKEASKPVPTAVPAQPTAAPVTKPAESKPAAVASPVAKPAEKAAVSPALAALIEGAKKETLIKGQWSESSFGGADGFRQVVDGMNKRWGLNLQAQFTPGPSMSNMLTKLGQEANAKQPASSDVFLGTATHMTDALKAGNVLKKMDWNSNPTMDRVAPDGIGVATGTRVVGVIYNSTLVKGEDVPSSLMDPLAPKWKGKIASNVGASGLYDWAAPDLLGYEFMKDYVIKLNKQIAGLMRCGENDRISSGEFAMLVPDCGGNDVPGLQAKGAPVAHTTFKEVGRLNIIYLGVPLNSSAPNAAALFVNYMHSPEGQALYWKSDGVDLHLYPESNTYEPVEKTRRAGGKLDISTPQRSAELEKLGFNLNQVRDEFVKLMTEGH